MKKLIPFLVVLAGALTAYPQAEVNFANNNLTPTNTPGQPNDRLVRFSGSRAPVVGTNLSAVLLYGTSATSLTAHTQPARFRVTTTSQPGTWSGGTRTLTGIANTPGTQITLQVAVYDNVQYASYAAALAGGGILGTSALFTFTVPTPPPGPTSFDMINFASFEIVPEPSVIALGLIGAGALFMLRRRKAA
jgi:hypothetical protein